MEKSHGVIPPRTWGFDVDGGVPITHVVSFSRILKPVECPVPGCPKIYHSIGRMREHFMHRKFLLKVAVL